MTCVTALGEQTENIGMRYEDENIRLTQRMMAVLYDVALTTIHEHAKKTYADSEREENATIRKSRTVQDEVRC